MTEDNVDIENPFKNPKRDNGLGPFTSIKVGFDKDHMYPWVEINARNGMRVRGWVVPEHLEDRLPSLFDGLQMWSNPLLDLDTNSPIDRLDFDPENDD